MGMLLKRHRRNQHVQEKRQSETRRKERQKVEKEQVNFSDYTVLELKELAKEKDIKGYGNMKKSELIEALKG